MVSSLYNVTALKIVVVEIVYALFLEMTGNIIHVIYCKICVPLIRSMCLGLKIISLVQCIIVCLRNYMCHYFNKSNIYGGLQVCGRWHECNGFATGN